MTYAINWIFAGGSMVLVILYIYMRIQLRKAQDRIKFVIEGFDDMVSQAMRHMVESKDKDKQIEKLIQHNLELIEQVKKIKKEENNG